MYLAWNVNYSLEWIKELKELNDLQIVFVFFLVQRGSVWCVVHHYFLFAAAKNQESYKVLSTQYHYFLFAAAKNQESCKVLSTQYHVSWLTLLADLWISLSYT